MAKERIQLTIHKPRDERRCVQITSEANAVLMGLYRATGLPVGHIVSQLIIQGAELVEIVEED